MPSPSWIRQLFASRSLPTVRSNRPRTSAHLTGETLENRVTPAILHWTGATSSSWGVASNWQENAIPVSGDTLEFTDATTGLNLTAGGPGFNSNNDIVGLANMKIYIEDTTNSGDFTITGNSFSVTGGVRHHEHRTGGHRCHD